MSKNPNIQHAIDLIQRSAAAGLKTVVEDVLEACDRDYVDVQMSMHTAYLDCAMHALANVMLSEEQFVREARAMVPSDKELEQRWRQHQAARRAATPAPEGFYR